MKQKSEIKRTGPELLKRLLRQREMSVWPPTACSPSD